MAPILAYVTIFCSLSVTIFAHYYYPHGLGGIGGGVSKVYQKQDKKGNYAFGYNVLDPKGASNYREESGDAWGNKAGSYGLRDKDGRLRIVHYVADKNGFRVKIDTNEPGVGSIDTPYAKINGPEYHGYNMEHVAHHKPYQPNVHPEPAKVVKHVTEDSYLPPLPAIPDVVNSSDDKKVKKMNDYDVDIPAVEDFLN